MKRCDKCRRPEGWCPCGTFNRAGPHPTRTPSGTPLAGRTLNDRQLLRELWIKKPELLRLSCKSLLIGESIPTDDRISRLWNSNECFDWIQSLQKKYDPSNRDVVCFLHDGEFIKIGFSNNLLSRVSNLQVANARLLFPILLLEAGEKTERRIHNELGFCNESGEWYRSSDVVEWLNSAESRGLGARL